MTLICEEKMTDTQSFGQWVKHVMKRKGLTVMTCARRALDENNKPMEHSQWNDIMEDNPRRTDGSPPQRSRKVARRVALGLDIPEREAFEAAGLLPPAIYLHEGRAESMLDEDEPITQRQFQLLMDELGFIRKYIEDNQ